MTVYRLIASIIGIGWLIFWVYWFVSAIGTKRNVNGGAQRWPWYHIILLIVVLGTIRLSHSGGSDLNYSSLRVHAIAAEVIGVFLFIAGLLFAVWARMHLGRNWGMPMSQKADSQLVTSGPYRYARHPIYTGILTASIGTALAISLYWLVIAVISGIYFIYSATQKEKYMTKLFPKEYPGYKKRTKMLIPYIL